jgi:uncharacterized membrane protein (DUF4010 family)
VSSTAVTLSCARQSTDAEKRATVLSACAILLAWCIMFGRVVVEVLVVNDALVASLLVPFVAMAAAAATAVGILYWRVAAGRDGREKPAVQVPLRNPFSLTEAAKFGAFFAAVLLVVKFVQSRFPGQGLYMVAGLAGLTDVDAITLSMAEYAKGGDTHVAVNAIVIATLANTIVKCGMVVALGAGALSRPIVLATVAILAVGVGAMVFL